MIEADYSQHLLCKLIRDNLTSDLLKPEYRDGDHPLAGHCYVASEAAYHLFARDLGFHPYFIRHEGLPHWFLRNGHVLMDLTAEQFEAPVPYNKAIRKGFLTRQPSKRARELMRRVNKELQ